LPRPYIAIHQGFTLIEMLVAASILCIFAAMAVPNFTNFVHSSRLTSAATALVSDFEIARSEAARRNVTVTICPTSDGINCINDWTQRRVTFVESTADSAIGPTDEVLRVSDASYAKLTVAIGNPDVSTGSKYIRFRSTGFLDGVASSFSLCESGSTAEGRMVLISSSGRATVQSATCL
jgi:type IV fimbrial biogenesis protein FimT